MRGAPDSQRGEASTPRSKSFPATSPRHLNVIKGGYYADLAEASITESDAMTYYDQHQYSVPPRPNRDSFTASMPVNQGGGQYRFQGNRFYHQGAHLESISQAVARVCGDNVNGGVPGGLANTNGPTGSGGGPALSATETSPRQARVRSFSSAEIHFNPGQGSILDEVLMLQRNHGIYHPNTELRKQYPAKVAGTAEAKLATHMENRPT